MSAHNVAKELHDSQAQIADPGASGTISIDRYCTVNLRSAGAETRTLALPTVQGVTIALHFVSDGGDITLTVASAYNELGSTTMVFSEVGQFAVLRSFMTVGGVYFWRLISNSNIGNNPLVVIGAVLTAQLTTITPATAEGTPDYAIAELVQNTGFGFVALQEGTTILYVIKNLQVRLAEVEARLEAAGIVTAN